MVQLTQKPKVYIGMDPGKAGGIVFIKPDGLRLCKSPETRRDMLVLIWEHTRGTDAFAVVEKVGGFIRTSAGPNVAGGSAMFKFGQSYERLLMALTALEIPFEEVTPQAWQKAMGITPRRKGERKRTKQNVVVNEVAGKESTTQFKNRLRAHAEALYPKEKITLAVADALLLAVYCQRLRTGTLRTEVGHAG